MERKVIVRADDLGYSDAVNVGIARTVHNGLINNVGVMVNMPTTMSG
ncbi:ChbG/HpnK family deacetylase, partial [Lactiplantibacillus plantarum]